MTIIFTLILFGRLCYALAFGVYISSFLKDLVCSPRPYAPPVVRLSKSVKWLFSPTIDSLFPSRWKPSP